MKHGHHRARVHRWINGRLEVIDEWYASVEEALQQAVAMGANSIKVYDPNGSLVHSSTQINNSYA